MEAKLDSAPQRNHPHSPSETHGLPRRGGPFAKRPKPPAPARPTEQAERADWTGQRRGQAHMPCGSTPYAMRARTVVLPLCVCVVLCDAPSVTLHRKGGRYTVPMAVTLHLCTMLRGLARLHLTDTYHQGTEELGSPTAQPLAVRLHASCVAHRLLAGCGGGYCVHFS